MMRDWTGSQWRDFRSGTEWENRGDRVTTLAKPFWTSWSLRISFDTMLKKSESLVYQLLRKCVGNWNYCWVFFLACLRSSKEFLKYLSFLARFNLLNKLLYCSNSIIVYVIFLNENKRTLVNQGSLFENIRRGNDVSNTTLYKPEDASRGKLFPGYGESLFDLKFL